jgi:hypothetical protein
MTFDPAEIERIVRLSVETRQAMCNEAVKAAMASEHCQPGTPEHAALAFIYHFASEQFEFHNAVIERFGGNVRLQ